ncbi:MAG: transposase [Candidatus Dormibacteraceae bacterium]
MLDAEAGLPERQIDQLTSATDPLLRSRFGVGPDTAAALLLAAGDNPARLRSDASFSMLCGSSPVPASSARPSGIASIEAVIARPMQPSTG